MKITRGLGYRVNLGNYEHVEFSAMITVSDDDLFTEGELESSKPDELVMDLSDFAAKHLDVVLAPELLAAKGLTTSKDSFVFEEPDPPPRTEKAIKRAPRPRK